ncbi:chaplin [Streptomyces leeuwenhoekii]|nr:chaplin [Streptomyces leeuwenhoekii]
MRQTLSRGVFAVAATSVLSLCGSSALADTQADGSAMNVPGASSGNTVQAPDHAPADPCGDTAHATDVLDTVFGDACADEPEETSADHDPEPERDPDSHDSGPGDVVSELLGQAQAVASADEGSRSTVQITDEESGLFCGALADAMSTLSLVTCADEDGGYGDDGYGDGGYGDGATPPVDHTPKETPPPADDKVTPPAEVKPPAADVEPPADDEDPPSLAETGAGALLSTAAVSTVLLAGGAVLYRRGRRTMPRQ